MRESEALFLFELQFIQSGPIRFSFDLLHRFRMRCLANVLAVSVATMLLLWWLCRRTDAGPAFHAIREDPILAESLGIDTTSYKLLAFTLSAAAAGLSGSLYAYYIQLVSPTIGSAGNSALVIGMAVFGGIGTTWGPFVGALLLYGLIELLRFVGVVYHGKVLRKAGVERVKE